MNCLKCGSETRENRVFCDDCLAQMERYPVKQGTPVWIPNRPASHPPTWRREAAPEELLARQRRKTKRLRLCVVCLSAALILAVAALVVALQNRQHEEPIGRNYSIEGEQSGR